jgi:BirA family biotin operon repressor/biotin-[acetyl-CoA-carboxylase] ligase
MIQRPLDSAAPLPSAVDLGLQELVHLRQVGSTMDEAHARAAAGASAGTLVLADEQTAGRGRSGNRWQSASGYGLWMTLLERPRDTAAVDVLSLRLGLAIAAAVEPFADERVRVKWPNDLFVGTRKLAGILVEARWRAGAIDWAAIGVGINLRVDRENTVATSLRAGTDRADVLRALVPALRGAAACLGPLTVDEQRQWAERDLATGRRVTAPVAGTVRGIERNGALRVEDGAGTLHQLRTGSLVFAAGDDPRARSEFN